MKAIKYKIQQLPINIPPADMTERLNNEQNRLNEEEAPVVGDVQPYWEVGDLLVIDGWFVINWVLWSERY